MSADLALGASPLVIGFLAGRASPAVQTSAPGVPPGAVFGIAWTILYAGLGVVLVRAVRRVRAQPSALATAILAVLTVHLVLNFSWTAAFAQSATTGLYVIAAVLATALSLLGLASSVDPWSGGIVGIYIGWLIFALTLNYGELVTNR